MYEVPLGASMKYLERFLGESYTYDIRQCENLQFCLQGFRCVFQSGFRKEVQPYIMKLRSACRLFDA